MRCGAAVTHASPGITILLEQQTGNQLLKKKTANKHCSEHGRHRSSTSNWYIIGSREYPQPPTTAVQEEPGNVDDGEENEDVVMGWREEA